MLSVDCPRHGTEVLLANNRIRGIDRSGDTLTVRWECYCGHVGATHRRVPVSGAAVRA
jgi:hypothetical protein